MNPSTNHVVTAVDQGHLSAIVRTIEALKGEDTVALDVRGFLIPTSFIVITSVNNVKQLQAVCEEVASCLDITPLYREGRNSAQWQVVDFGSIIVHVMSEEARSFYELDELWEGVTVALPVESAVG